MAHPSRATQSAMAVAIALALAAAAPPAVAQAGRPATAQAAQPERSRPTRSYPAVRAGGGERRAPSPYRNHPLSPRIVYVPVPVDYYGASRSHGGVYDTNGRPLANQHEAAEAYAAQTMSFQAYTPDLSGSPYVVIDGGAMVVDFGDGLRRTVVSCAASAAEGTPDSKPRTIFYRPPSDGIIFRRGHTGRVRGTPPAGADVCYAADPYGRTELRY